MTSYFSEDGPVQLGSLVIGQIQSTGTENGGSKCLTAAKLATGKPRESDQFQYGLLAQQAWNISVSFCGGAANDCIVGGLLIYAWRVPADPVWIAGRNWQ